MKRDSKEACHGRFFPGSGHDADSVDGIIAPHRDIPGLAGFLAASEDVADEPAAADQDGAEVFTGGRSEVRPSVSSAAGAGPRLGGAVAASTRGHHSILDVPSVLPTRGAMVG